LRDGDFLRDFDQGHRDAPPVLNRLEELGYVIEQASKHEDMKEGIDFYITDGNGMRTSVQLKCCRRIEGTKNFYFQTTKVIPTPGKNKTVSASQWLYYDVGNRVVYNFLTSELQARWDELVTHGKFHRKQQLHGGFTEGYIVSLSIIEELGFKFKKVKI
jgi:hypothetical protein